MTWFFWFYDLDIINEYDHYWAIDSCKDDKDIMVCIDMLEAKSFK